MNWVIIFVKYVYIRKPDYLSPKVFKRLQKALSNLKEIKGLWTQQHSF